MPPSPSHNRCELLPTTGERLGKRKLGESDCESDSEEDGDEKRTGIKEEEKEESFVVIDNGGHSDSSKEVEASSGSVAGGSIEQGSFENGSEKEGTEEPLKSVNGQDGNGNTHVLESPTKNHGIIDASKEVVCQ